MNLLHIPYSIQTMVYSLEIYLFLVLSQLLSLKKDRIKKTIIIQLP